MKISVLLICLIFFCLFITGCDDYEYDIDLESESDIEFISEITSANDESESSIIIEEIYEFLESAYTVTSTRESFGTVYVCDYYFDKGYVVGARLKTTFPDEENAEEYFEIVYSENSYADLDSLTVTDYISGDELNYYGYDLEKLKFMLEKSGCSYTVNFDEDRFNNEFYSRITE